MYMQLGRHVCHLLSELLQSLFALGRSELPGHNLISNFSYFQNKIQNFYHVLHRLSHCLLFHLHLSFILSTFTLCASNSKMHAFLLLSLFLKRLGKS